MKSVSLIDCIELHRFEMLQLSNALQEMEESAYSGSASKAVYLGKLAAAARSALNTAKELQDPFLIPTPSRTYALDPNPAKGAEAAEGEAAEASGAGTGRELECWSSDCGSGDPSQQGVVTVEGLEEKVARLEVQGDAPLPQSLQLLKELKEAR